MMGFIVSGVVLVTIAAGLEIGSHGTILALTHAAVVTWHNASTHQAARICAELARLGDHNAVCAVYP